MSGTAVRGGPEPRAGADLLGLAGARLGNYRLERLLGQGRMGAVYLAKDEALLRPTAVKVLQWSTAEAHGQDPVQWFLAEARLVARINHPRVVQVYGAARQGDRCYIAMEYVAGPSAEALVAGGPVAPEAATDILLQVASALQAAHRSSVVHRDVKPANILIGPGNVAKLGDFGMALARTEQPLGAAHVRVGTPFYTAPEIWLGEPATPASDLYALGATYYHLLTGRPPFTGADLAAVEEGHLRAPVPDPRRLVPGLPAAAAEFVQRALAKQPRERHPSAEEVLWDARRVLQELVAAGGAPAVVHAPGPAASAARAAPAAPASPSPRPRAAPVAPPAAPAADAAPFAGEPFASVRARLLAALEDPETPVVSLVGEAGAGKTTLVRALVAELGRSRTALLLDLGEPSGHGFVQRLCRAVGVVEEPAEEGRLEALVAALGAAHGPGGAPALVVLDGASVHSGAGRRDLFRMVAAARWARTFKLVVVGAPGLAELVAPAGDGAGPVPELLLPRLDAAQAAAFVQSRAAGATGARGVRAAISPDALALLVHRTQGNPARLACALENMQRLARAERAGALTSWHAWIAPDAERWTAATQLPVRPAAWPTPEARAAIDAGRRAAGRPPFPAAPPASSPALPPRSPRT